MRVATPPTRPWSALPLRLRMAVYATCFLALVLVLLPWCADRLGRALLPGPVELGGLRAVGWTLAVVGLLSYACCATWLVRHGAGAYVEFDPPTRLVTTGPYARCRNPVVLSVLALLVGLSIGLSSVGVGVLALAALACAAAQVVWVEEPRLKRRFGADYERYAARVPRWNPLGRRRSAA